MFEAILGSASLLRKVIEALKDLVTDANLECHPDALTLQAMDSSHVSLVALKLKSTGFDKYRCDRNISLGVNLVNMSKILKCAGSDDSLTLKADDEGDTASFRFEGEDGDRVSEFELKLMDIDSEGLGIPDTDYKCVVKMPSSEFQRIVRDLSVLGDTIIISCNKEGVNFKVKGDLGSGHVMRKQSTSAEKAEDHTTIEMDEPTELTFALRYLQHFTKATPLSPFVALRMSKDVPLMVEYKVDNLGHLRYYLAPKIDDAENS